MLPPQESAAAVREAFRRGLVVDGIKMWMLPLRTRIHARRREIGRALAADRPSPLDSASGAEGRSGLLQASRLAREWFRADPPAGGSTAGAFRAAGGKRVSSELEARSSSDAEDSHAWDRLSWALEPGGSHTLVEMSRWLDAPLSEQARHPYTTSERICNLAQLLGSLGEEIPGEMAERLVRRLLEDAERLSHRFETHLGTHNHLLNNARALFAAGRLAGDSERGGRWLGQARAVWDELWPKLILDDGSFGEQSSHYHVLLTRTLLDYVRDARGANRPLPPGMFEKARAMCRVTNALMRPDGSLPLFGDISPDVPTSWLRGLPRVCARSGLLDESPRDPASGYAAGGSAGFRDVAFEGAAPSGVPPLPGWQTRLFPRGGYLLASGPGISLELAAHGDPRPGGACHGDAGRGSFEIWFRGRPIVVDGGMPTYQPGELRDRFRGAAGQNVVSIDGLSPALLQDQARDLPRWYVDSLEGGAWRSDSTSATFTWNGFRRHRPGLTWVRTFRWSGSGLRVEDRLEGWVGHAEVEAFLHFGARGWMHPSKGLFTIEGCRVRLASPDELAADLEEMAHATDYGVLVNGQGIRMSGQLKLPATWSWSFDFESGA